MHDELCDRQLASGLRVVAVRRGSGPLAEARLHIPAPAPTARRAASRTVLARCMSVRCRHTAAHAAAEFRVVAGAEGIVVSSGCAVGGLHTALELVADSVSGAWLPAADIVLQREQARARRRLLLAEPLVMARLALLRGLFGEHPATRLVDDDTELAAVEAADIAALHGTLVRPQSATLVIVGPEEPARAVAVAAAMFGDWEPGGTDRAIDRLPPLVPGQPSVVASPDPVQAWVRLRSAALPIDDPAYPALQVATQLVGGGGTSRLARTLRDRRGIVYNVAGYTDVVAGVPLLAIDATTTTSDLVATFDALAAEFAGMRSNPPADAEVAAATRSTLGAVTWMLSSRSTLASAMVNLAAHGADAVSLLDLPHRLRRMGPGTVADTAVEHFDPERFAGVVIADVANATPLSLTPMSVLRR